MSAKHTPTPWAVTHNKRMGCFTIHHTAWCERGQTSKIAAPLISLEDDTDQANAEFIVCAVNAHDDLVAALNLAVSMLAHLEPGDSRAVSDEFVALAAVSSGIADDKTRAVISAALAKAEAL